MFTITASTDVLESILFLILIGMPEIIGAFLAMEAFIVHAGSLAVATLQACKGDFDRAGDGAESR